MDDAAAALATVRAAPEAAHERDVQRPRNTPFKPPVTTPEKHRREHRSGRPRRLDTAPELRAYVGDRIDHLMFAQVADAVAERVPQRPPLRHPRLVELPKEATHPIRRRTIPDKGRTSVLFR